MMKDVWISITNRQRAEQGVEDTMVFDTDGYYFFDDGIGVLSYQESELTGLEGTRTSVMVMPDQVVIDRDGTLTGRMVFREGTRDTFPYSTPYGVLPLGIDTRRIRHCFNENGGDVEIDYIANLAHTFVTKNHFRISVKEMEKSNGQPD